MGILAYLVSIHPANLLHGTRADFTKQTRQAIIHTKPDCVIFFSTVGCRHGGGSEKISKDMVEREFGIPWITLDVDVLDKRLITKEKIADKLEGFFETVENSKPYQARRDAK